MHFKKMYSIICSCSVLPCLQGVGGTTQYPKDFLRRAYEVARESGAVCVADEVRLLTNYLTVTKIQ